MTEAVLPAGHTWRAPTLADAPQITELVLAHDAQFLAAPDVTLAQIAALLQERTVDLDTRAWLVHDPEGHLRGTALVYLDTAADEAELDIYPHPGADEAMIDWLLNRGRASVEQARGDTGQALPLMAGLHQDDVRSVQVYESAGLRRVRMFWRMGMALTTELPAIGLRDGYRMRRVRPDDADLREFHKASEVGFADHWRAHPLPYEVWMQDLEQLAGFDLGQWWIVEAADGDIAATMVGAHRMRELGAGYVYSLSTVPDHRGRGLAKALLRRAMHDAAEFGYDRLQLTVDAANPTGAVRLYESVGMQPVAAFSIYSDEG